MLQLLKPAHALSDTSQRVAEINCRLIGQHSYANEFIERLATSLATPVGTPTNRFPLGKDGANQVADLVERFMLLGRYLSLYSLTFTGFLALGPAIGGYLLQTNPDAI